MLRTHLMFGVLTASLLGAALASVACAADSGLYAGRTLLSGQPAIAASDEEAGAQPLGERGARLAGDRRYLGYLFHSGLTVEASELRLPGQQLDSATDAIGLMAGITLDVADKVSAAAKAGLHLPSEDVVRAFANPAFTTPEKLYEVRMAYRAVGNVELSAKFQRLDGYPGPSWALPSEAVLLGAEVRF